MVINGCRLRCTPFELDRQLAFPNERNAERQKTCKAVADHFPLHKRRFLTVPTREKTGFYESLAELCKQVHECPPLISSKTPFDGSMFFNLVHRTVEAINSAKPLQPDNVYDGVLKEHGGRLAEIALKAEQGCSAVGSVGPCPSNADLLEPVR